MKNKFSKLEQEIISSLNEIKQKHPDKHFGALIFLGYDAGNDAHGNFVSPLKGDDYFKEKEINVYDKEFKPALYDCVTGPSHDGAILIDKDGNIIQNDTCLQFHPNYYLNKRKKEGNNFSKQFGFAEIVFTRHLTAKCISFELGVSIVTLSEQTGHIRLFKNGYTIYSDISSEIEKIPVKKRYRLYRRFRHVG